MAKKIEVSSKVLKKLRELSGYSIEEIAKKLKTTTKKVQELEKGEDKPTLSQIKKLADIYKRPLIVFFEEDIPEEPKLTDYRINRSKSLEPTVYLAQRRAYYLSEQIKELSGKKSYIPEFSENLSAEKLAREFRKFLGIDLLKELKPEEMLRRYKQILEKKLTIIIIEYPLKSNDVRAFSIYSDISSIVLNEDDSSSIKLFSLFHEVCHLIKRNSAICSIEIENNEDIESYCNKFSAEFLVPSDDLKTEIKNFRIIDRNTIDKLAKIYGVSKQVIMLRLLWLKYIDKQKYEEFKKEIEEKLKEKPKSGYRNWDKVFFNRVGNLCIEEVSKAYYEGKITLYSAISILGIKRKYAEKFISSND